MRHRGAFWLVDEMTKHVLVLGPRRRARADLRRDMAMLRNDDHWKLIDVGDPPAGRVLAANVTPREALAVLDGRAVERVILLDRTDPTSGVVMSSADGDFFRVDDVIAAIGLVGHDETLRLIGAATDVAALCLGHYQEHRAAYGERAGHAESPLVALARAVAKRKGVR